MHEMREPLARVIELLNIPENKHAATVALGRLPGNEGYVDIKSGMRHYETLVDDLNRISRALP